MAATPVQFAAPQGLSGLVLKLFALGSDTQVNPTGGGDAATEATNRKGIFTATVDEALTGWHEALIFSSTVVVASYVVFLRDTTARCYCVDSDQMQAAIDGKTLDEAQRIIGAATAGLLSGAGTATEVMTGLDGTTTRITGTVDGSGNRSAAVYG